jgi:protein-export membrane protein SecD
LAARRSARNSNFMAAPSLGNPPRILMIAVLTIGMAVDSNVLIFERIREELRAGRSAARALTAGFSKAFATLFDTHVTTVVSCVFLFFLGTPAIKGFATTLAIGLTINLSHPSSFHE